LFPLKKKAKTVALDLLNQFIVFTGQPFSLVEEPSFQEFILTLNSSFKIPNRKAFSCNVEDIFLKKQKELISFFVVLK